jgi:hypothetical protein
MPATEIVGEIRAVLKQNSRRNAGCLAMRENEA